MTNLDGFKHCRCLASYAECRIIYIEGCRGNIARTLASSSDAEKLHTAAGETAGASITQPFDLEPQRRIRESTSGRIKTNSVDEE